MPKKEKQFLSSSKVELAKSELSARPAPSTVSMQSMPPFGNMKNLARIRASLVAPTRSLPSRRSSNESNVDLDTKVQDAQSKRDSSFDLGSGTLSEEESFDDGYLDDTGGTSFGQSTFFDELGSIPSITDIRMSTVEKIDVDFDKKETKKIPLKGDMGKFVDPLTGEVISSSSSLTPTTGLVVQVEEEEEAMEEDDDDFMVLFDDELLEEPEIFEDEGKETKEEPKDDLELWNELQPVRVVKMEDEIDFEARMREEELRLIWESTQQFLGEMIDEIVEKCEYVDPKVILRKNLNKKLLMNELDNLVCQMEVEQKVHLFLNRKVIEHYRRKKSFRAITDDSADTITKNIELYEKTRNKLDQLLGREKEIETVVGEKTFLLFREIEAKENQFRQQQKILEDMIKKTLHRESFERLQAVIELQLRRMMELRHEITQVRTDLLQRQDTMGSLIEQSEKLDSLGEGLRLGDFVTLSNETQSLERKNEERSNDLLKLHRRFSANLHARAHIREKLSCFNYTVNVQEQVLDELMEDHQMVRTALVEQKLQRARLVKEIREQSFQGGLLDKPALLFDYDETEERLEKLRHKVQSLKSKKAEMQVRLNVMEKKQKGFVHKVNI